MALRTLDRLVLIPALIVLGSITLAGCSLLPGAGASNSSSSSSSDDKADAGDDAEAEETEAEDVEDDAAGGCPASITDSAATMAGVDGDVDFISSAEFAAPVVGTEYLEGACLFRVVVDTEGSASSTDIGYLAGDAATVAAISANLEAGGYTKVTDGIFTLNDKSGVFVFGSDDTMSAAEVEQLGFGDSVVVVMATTTE